MKSHTVLAPRLGESVREVRIVTRFKESGETVLRDEPLVEIETDKAVYSVESPENGAIERWWAAPGDVIPVGADLVTLRLLDGMDRSRELEPEKRGYSDARLSPRQRALSERLCEAHRTVAPAWITMNADWDGLQARRRAMRSGPAPSSSTLLAWDAISAMRNHAAFRSALLGGDRVRRFERATIGLAVALPKDELSIARVEDCGNFEMFRDALEAAARSGQGAHGPDPQLHFTYMAHFGVVDAAPLVIPPAVASLFVGAPSRVAAGGADGSVTWKRLFRLTLGFDHRLINGAGAAKFLREVARPRSRELTRDATLRAD